MGEDLVNEILSKYKKVAVVGISRNPSKDSHIVSKYLKNHGFQVVPVNPFVDELLGEKCYKSLVDIPVAIQKTLEIVNIFRPSSDVLPIVKQVMQIKRQYSSPYVVWMQIGIIHERAATLARKAHLTVIMDKCIMQEHHRIVSSTNPGKQAPNGANSRIN